MNKNICKKLRKLRSAKQLEMIKLKLKMMTRYLNSQMKMMIFQKRINLDKWDIN